MKVSATLDRGIWKLRWTSKGKRYSLSTGISSTQQNKQRLNEIIRLIERDIKLGIVQSPVYYREIINPRLKPLSLAEIFQKFAESKKPFLQPSTQKTIYKMINSILSRFPLTLENASELPTWLANAKYSPHTIYRVVSYCKSSLDWALSKNLIAANPLAGVKPPKVKKKKEINPFTTAECNLILESAKMNPTYYFLIKFLLLTGCRPSEALALEWIDVDFEANFITFNKSLVAGTLKKNLKTQSHRKFPINSELKDLLIEIRENSHPEGRLFPNLNWDAFRRFWKKLLIQNGIIYRSPYNLRHTFISLVIHHGLTPTSVSRLVGNSPKIIFQHYLGLIDQAQVPVFGHL